MIERLYIAGMAILFVFIVAMTTGCGLKAAGVKEVGRDDSSETMTSKITTSGPVAEIVADVAADVEASLIKTEKRISTRIEAARDSVQNEGVKSIHVLAMFIGYFVVSKITDIARDWLRIRRKKE